MIVFVLALKAGVDPPEYPPEDPATVFDQVPNVFGIRFGDD